MSVSAARVSPIGKPGHVAANGRIEPGSLGEVLVDMGRGAGIRAYYAHDADGGIIEPEESVVVVEQVTSNVVLVTRLPGG